jgi:hypothetical protein
VRDWKALVWGGMISEVGFLSLCGAPPRGVCVAPRSLVLWVGESESGSPEVKTRGKVVALELGSGRRCGDRGLLTEKTRKPKKISGRINVLSRDNPAGAVSPLVPRRLTGHKTPGQ